MEEEEVEKPDSFKELMRWISGVGVLTSFDLESFDKPSPREAHIRHERPGVWLSIRTKDKE